MRAMSARAVVHLLVAIPALLAASAGTGLAQELTEEWGYKRPGGEYRTFRAGNLENCMHACKADRRCLAYVYRTGSTECSLKKTVGTKERDNNRVSGVKRTGGGSWDNDYGYHRGAADACRKEVSRRYGVGPQDVRLEYDDFRNDRSYFIWRAVRKRGNCVANNKGRVVEFNDWGWGNASNPQPKWDRSPEDVCRREVERRVGVSRGQIDVSSPEYAGGAMFLDWRGGGERGTCELNARTGEFVTLQGYGNSYDWYDPSRPSQDQITRGSQTCRAEAAKRMNTRMPNVEVEFKRVKEGALVYSWRVPGASGKCAVSEYGRVGYFERD